MRRDDDTTRMLELRLHSGTVVAFDGRVLEIFDAAEASRRFHVAQLSATDPVAAAGAGCTLELGDGSIVLSFAPEEPSSARAWTNHNPRVVRRSWSNHNATVVRGGWSKPQRNGRRRGPLAGR